MDQLKDATRPQIRLFNTAIEIGLRCLILMNLINSNEATLDAEKLMYLDYLSLNTADVGGPESINAPIPKRGVQVYSRKDLVQKGLVYLLSKELIDVNTTESGFSYSITKAGKIFLELFTTKYFNDLQNRATWVTSRWGLMSNGELKSYIDSNLALWGGEFVANEISNEI
jgi:hypothetical protein